MTTSHSDAILDDLMQADPQLYLAGHAVRRGYAVMRQYQRCDTVRFYQSIDRARTVIDRWNRMVTKKAGRA